jgi:hypothetical protein
MFGEKGCRMRTSEIRGLLLAREFREDSAFGKEIAGRFTALSIS